MLKINQNYVSMMYRKLEFGKSWAIKRMHWIIWRGRSTTGMDKMKLFVEKKSFQFIIISTAKYISIFTK